MKNTLTMFVIVASITLSHTLANCIEMPSFLPDYYSTVFKMDGQDFTLVRHSTKEGVEQYLYSTKDDTLFLSIENIKADRPKSKAIMENFTRFMGNEMDVNGGEFIKITQNAIQAKIHNNGIKRTIFVYAFPSTVQIWTFSGLRSDSINLEDKFQIIRNLANKQRYVEAQAEGNVSMGLWGPEIHDYARNLIRDGKKEEALAVLEKLLATSPYNFSAHLDFIENTTDTKTAANNAGIVIRNAEDAKFTEAASKYLGKKPISIESIPILEKGESGLQVILIPLEPCDLSLLDNIAKTYQKITNIPVKIRRLRESWKLNAPERIPYQRVIQEAIIKMSGENVKFTDWNKDKYISELKNVAEQKDALTKYYIKELIQKVEKEQGQYYVDTYLNWFLTKLGQYRGNDNKTMYVGITGINIYSGDNNYIFSLHMNRNESQASILSYYMMQAKNLSEEHESRNRLIERISKELVPASLKSLKIPRSTDPTCPYSYSNGVARLDEKTLQLSDSVISAINNLRYKIR